MPSDLQRLALLLLLFLVDLSCGGCYDIRPVVNEPYLFQSQSAETIRRYDILELSFKHNGKYENKFFDVDVAADFISPRGVTHHTRGFFYGRDLWKVRFRPDQPGTWTYSYIFTGKGGFSMHASGGFRCLPSDEDGPVRSNPENPFRWVFASRRPFFPVGLEDCVYMSGAQLMDPVIDGEDRNHPGRKISWDEYFSIYGQVGFNLFRFSQKNCSYSLVDDLDHYREAESIMTDDLLSSARKHGFRVMFGFFGIHGNWPSDNRTMRVLKRTVNEILGTRQEALWAPDNMELIRKEERFIQYCIARWGAYTDFWELLNERKASDKWTTLIAEYTRSVDPDKKPISTSWEKPDLAVIDINSPHWYEEENEISSDLRVQQQATKWKQEGKPVIVGEQGNSGMNWDPLSAERMRIRVWTALFQEISLVFWNTSWSKAGMHGGRVTPGAASNIYLGPQERRYIRVVQDFASRLDSNVHIIPVRVNSSSPVRAYGLASQNITAVYLRHGASQTIAVQDAEISLESSPSSHSHWIGEWIHPATGERFASANVSSGPITLMVPPFRVDIALVIGRGLVKPHANP